MAQYIDKDALVAEIDNMLKTKEQTSHLDNNAFNSGRWKALKKVKDILNTLEVKDSYEQCVQYDSIKAGIKAHAETYSFNIESELFHQLTKEQQELWRKEIEQACISGGDAGYSLARDRRYKESLEVKKVDLEKEFDNYAKDILACDVQFEPFTHLYNCAKYFYKLGLAQKGE